MSRRVQNSCPYEDNHVKEPRIKRFRPFLPDPFTQPYIPQNSNHRPGNRSPPWARGSDYWLNTITFVYDLALRIIKYYWYSPNKRPIG